MRKKFIFHDQHVSKYIHPNFREILRHRKKLVLSTAAAFRQVLVVACENEVEIHDQHVRKLQYINFREILRHLWKRFF